MGKKKMISRRRFLTGAAGLSAAAVGFPYLVSSSALGKAGNVAASNRIIVGCIGVGPQGTGVMGNFLRQKDARVVAICDLKKQRRQTVQNIVNKHYQDTGCRTYEDFRELVARDDIDVVLVATADHWHVLTSLAAVKSGKDVYMEKPMGLSVT
nr:Gfo/Idh/MocA family oxidoreductase [Phycisphaerae bacterium]NIU08453.1 Gfo/Idh/MocA family oxidoreductase [Phycisphaerae bacterium]NIU55958.1 Gfo/Idh/MocA family oxidoreductase [Phycisphaerae bacterium]NIW92471.1 Gfo/Idh/MocA family oxidoreductase [Phycisphaerae bacterium]